MVSRFVNLNPVLSDKLEVLLGRTGGACQHTEASSPLLLLTGVVRFRVRTQSQRPIGKDRRQTVRPRVVEDKVVVDLLRLQPVQITRKYAGAEQGSPFGIVEVSSREDHPAEAMVNSVLSFASTFDYVDNTVPETGHHTRPGGSLPRRIAPSSQKVA